jgi:DNA-binding MarR family transcriptional regulator
VVLDACEPRFTELGIDPKEYFVIAEVADSPYPAELAKVLATPKASVTGYVRSLVSKGLITREIDGADLRKHHLQLTSQGESVRDAASSALAEEFERRLGVVTSAQRAQLQGILETILSGSA